MYDAHPGPDPQPILFWVIRSPNPKMGDEAEGLRLAGVDCTTLCLAWAAGSAAGHKGLLCVTPTRRSLGILGEFPIKVRTLEYGEVDR